MAFEFVVLPCWCGCGMEMANKNQKGIWTAVPSVDHGKVRLRRFVWFVCLHGEASVVVPAPRCVLAHICLNTRTGRPLSPLSNGKPMWCWQAEVWLIWENLRARNGCIESLDDISQHKWHCFTELRRSAVVCHYVAKSFLDFAESALRNKPLSLVSVAWQSHPQQTYTAPLKHAAWFENLTLCTRILPDRKTGTFSLPCLSESVVEMQSVAKPRILSPHVKLQVVSIWKNMETFTCVIPLAFIADATQQKQWYTAERDETVVLFYLLNLLITTHTHSFWQGAGFCICDQASS